MNSEVKLTTIRHPKQAMGIQAARFMVDMLEGRAEKPQYMHDPELIVRKSCRNI
jgi:GntR family transcriptional regulator of arabinose operon